MDASKPWSSEDAEYPEEKYRGEWWQRGLKNSQLTPERVESMKAVIRALNETYSMTNREMAKYVHITGLVKEVQSVVEAISLRFPLWEEEQDKNVSWYGLLWKIDPAELDKELGENYGLGENR